MNSIVIRAPFCIKSGYETLSETICLELSKIGISVYPISSNGEITNPVIRTLIKPLTKDILSKLELCILPIQTDVNDYNRFIKMPKSNNRVTFTMWESTQLPIDTVDELNKNKCIIVPNKWNKKNFLMDGVSVPIELCPLFVDTSIFYYKPHNNDIFTFGTGNSDPRKRLNDVIRCFCKSFAPNVKDVKLNIKIDLQDLDKINKFSDNRISINTNKLSKIELSKWYNLIDVFVSGTSSEGWGLMQHEAMACGRPLIACKYSGLEEFFNESVGFPVKYTEVLAEWSWGFSNGFWSKFDEDDMIEKLRWCYNNINIIKEMGIKSAKEASKYNTNNFINCLIKILNKF